MANPTANDEGAPHGDGCIPITNNVGRLAGKLGGELLKNRDGTYVLKGAGAKERIFPDEVSAHDALRRQVRALDALATGHATIAEIEKHGGDLQVTNWEDLARNAKDLSDAAERAPGGEQAPFFSRSHKGIGQVFQGGDASNLATRGHAVLMQLGDTGRVGANAIRQRDVSSEQLVNAGWNELQAAAEPLERWATAEELGNKTAPQEAELLRQKVVEPFLQKAEEMYNFLGKPLPENIFNESGFPRMYAAREEDLPVHLIEKARKRGYVNREDGAKELRRLLNDPAFGGPRAGESPQATRERIAWLQKHATVIGRDSAHYRIGDQNYIQSPKAVLQAANRQIAADISEAAFFGPNRERIDEGYERVKSERGSDAAEMYRETMKDALGNDYVARTPFERGLTDVQKFALGSSMTRHIAQLKIPIMQFGVGDSAAALGKWLANPQNWAEDFREHNAFGVTLKQTQMHFESNPGDRFIERPSAELEGMLRWAHQNIADPVHILAKITTFPLHMQLNFDRVFAGILAKNNFDHYFEKALAGDRNKLALFADMLGFGDPTTQQGREAMVAELKNMNKAQIRGHFIKRIADTAGTTFHRADLPGLSGRALGSGGSRWGRYLTTFRTFRWNVHHNIWNQMTSPNYSPSYRARVLLRFLGPGSLLSAVDPFARAVKLTGAASALGALGVGVANLDSRIAHDAAEKALKDPTTSNALYGWTMLMVNDGTLGIASDWVQGFNMSNSDIFNRAFISGNIPVLDDAGALAISAAMGVGALSGDKKDKEAAWREFLTVAPFSGPIAYGSGVRHQPRVPKKQRIRTILHKGAEEIGLH